MRTAYCTLAFLLDEHVIVFAERDTIFPLHDIPAAIDSPWILHTADSCLHTTISLVAIIPQSRPFGEVAGSGISSPKILEYVDGLWYNALSLIPF